MSEHTKEPWRVRDESKSGFGVWVDAPEAMVSNPGGRSYPRQILEDEEYPEKLADARRIVACVNACAGISTAELEAAGTIAVECKDEMQVELLKAWKQRDDLLAALKNMAAKFEASGAAYMSDADWQQASAAITNAEGQS